MFILANAKFPVLKEDGNDEAARESDAPGAVQEQGSEAEFLDSRATQRHR